MRSALLDAFRALPQRLQTDDPDHWGVRWHAALEEFRADLMPRYTEGTLVRLLESPDAETRQAATLAVGLLGTMASNADLAGRLRDEELAVRGMAADALWQLWFRAGSDTDRRELERLIRLPPAAALPGLDALVARRPEYAEAANQRAIMHFRRGEFALSARDCQTVLGRNPYHFGAAAGLGQCLIRLDKPRGALQAFRNALRIHPGLDGVAEAVRSLEEMFDR